MSNAQIPLACTACKYSIRTVPTEIAGNSKKVASGAALRGHMLIGMSDYTDRVHSLYSTAQDFMERCQQQTCAAALGELVVANGLMLARSAQAYKDWRPRTVHPRLIVVTGRDPEERYAFDVATFVDESLMSPLVRLAHLLPNEAHNVPFSRRPFARLSRPSISNLTYNISTARPVRISNEHAEHFFNRMLRHIMVG